VVTRALITDGMAAERVRTERYGGAATRGSDG
jgi:hypothetical protein